MPVSIRQTSFAGGEISPNLYGRSDLAKYHVSLKRLRNFFAARQGAAVSRPGTVYCGEVKSSGAGKVRLIPFVYSDALSFVLEFGNGYIRFWMQGSWVGTDGALYTAASVSPPAPFEVSTPYVTADLPTLKYAQLGGVVTLTQGNNPPAELTFGGASNKDWTYAALSFDRPASASATIYVQEPILPGCPALGSVPAWDSGKTYSIDDYAAKIGLVYRSLDNNNNGNSPTDSSSTHWALDMAHPGMPWQYLATELWRDARGNPYEKAPVKLSAGFTYYGQYNGRLTYKVGTQVTSTGKDAATGASDGGSASTTYRCLVSNKGQLLSNGTYWVVDSTGTSPTPTQTDVLPTSFCVSVDRPVSIVLSSIYANALVDGSFIGYRIYRGQGSVSGWVGDLNVSAGTSFTDVGAEPDYQTQPPQGTNPFKVLAADGTLLRTEYPSVCTFFEERRVFGNTSQRKGWFWLSVVGNYTNFDRPLFPTVDESLAFELASRRLEEIRFQLGVGPKLLMGTQSAVWSVAGNGGPLSFSNVDAKKQAEVGSAWVDPVVVDGACLFVRTKGSGLHSLVFDVIRDGFAEQDLCLFASHLFIGQKVVDMAYAQDPWSLVYAVRGDGTMLVLTYLRSQDVLAWGWYDTPGCGGLYENACVVPEGTEDVLYVVVNRTVNGVVHRFIERQSTRVVTQATLPQAVSLDCAGIYSGAPTSTLTGLTWLAGQTVWAVADGNVDGPLAVDASGNVTLTNPASYVIAGLPYTPELQQLDLASAASEIKTREKQVVRVGIEVDNTRGLYVGPDFAHLDELKQRQVSDSYGTVGLASKLYRVAVRGNWAPDAGVAIRQALPLPLTVCGITREVEFGDP